MQRIIAGATGLVGTALVNRWLEDDYAVTVIGRSADKISKQFQGKVKAIQWDALTLDALKDAEVVVNLTGAGIAEKRWTAARKQEIIDSRVRATSKLSKLLGQLGAESPPLLNASAIGVYGLQPQSETGLPSAFTEDAVIPCDAPPDFLSKVGCVWEKATKPASDAGVRVVNLRFGVVLAKEGGALPQIVMPFKFFIGGRVGSGRQPFSWVAIDDLVRAIDFLVADKSVSGPVNIVAPGAVTQLALAQSIGRVLHKPALMITPGIMLKVMLGEMASELLLEGQHVYPKRLHALGFTFKYPDIDSALQHIYLNRR